MLGFGGASDAALDASLPPSLPLLRSLAVERASSSGELSPPPTLPPEASWKQSLSLSNLAAESNLARSAATIMLRRLTGDPSLASLKESPLLSNLEARSHAMTASRLSSAPRTGPADERRLDERCAGGDPLSDGLSLDDTDETDACLASALLRRCVITAPSATSTPSTDDKSDERPLSSAKPVLGVDAAGSDAAAGGG